MHIRGSEWPFNFSAKATASRLSRASTKHQGERPTKSKKLHTWILLGLSALANIYLFWNHRPVPPATPIAAPAAAHAPAKLDIPTPLPALSTRSGTNEIIARAELANELVYTDLQRFVCDEEMQRFRGTLDGAKIRQIDTVTSKVSFENGTEHYSDIRQNSRERASLSKLSGAWSMGEFGTLLRETRALLGTKSALLKEETEVNGTPAAEYVMQVSREESPWNMAVDTGSYRIPFETHVWISKATGQILKIERMSTQMPSWLGISEVRWNVTLEPTQLGSNTWLLPKNGWYEVTYSRSNRREWNALSFSNYRRYGAETVLHF